MSFNVLSSLKAYCHFLSIKILIKVFQTRNYWGPEIMANMPMVTIYNNNNNYNTDVIGVVRS